MPASGGRPLGTSRARARWRPFPAAGTEGSRRWIDKECRQHIHVGERRGKRKKRRYTQRLTIARKPTPVGPTDSVSCAEPKREAKKARQGGINSSAVDCRVTSSLHVDPAARRAHASVTAVDCRGSQSVRARPRGIRATELGQSASAAPLQSFAAAARGRAA